MSSSIAIVAPVSRIPQKKEPSPVHKKASRIDSRDSGYLDDASETSSTNGSPDLISPLTETSDSVFLSPTRRLKKAPLSHVSEGFVIQEKEHARLGGGGGGKLGNVLMS